MPVKTAGLEVHSLVLVSAQLKQTLTLLYIKKGEQWHIIGTVISIMHYDFSLLFLMFFI